MQQRLAGKTALVTGAASGLGKAIAAHFVAQGARVLWTDRDAAAVQAAAAESGSPCAVLDVTQEKDWQSALDKARAALGGLHILVNNAGMCEMGTVEDTDLAAWRRQHAVNLDGVFLGCHTALPLMAETVARTGVEGAILNISSVAAMVAASNMAAYNSSKAAVRHLTKSVALHCARKANGIRCNSLHPTFIDTPLLDGMTPNQDRDVLLQKLARQIPLGRVGAPEDVALAAVYLCSDESRFITGAELLVDGGLSAQ